MSSNPSTAKQVLHSLGNAFESVVQSLASEVNAENVFSSYIAGEVKPGLTIAINGQVLQNADRFDVNLMAGGRNVAFHFNPRFSQNCVVRNTLNNGSWGEEERDGALPFIPSKAFEMVILATEARFRVTIDGRHFTDYKHRLPLNQVTHIRIRGDVLINCVKNGTQPLYLKTENPLASRPSTLYNPILPVNLDVRGKVLPGFIIYISGKPLPDPYRFEFNFKDSRRIQFHFQARFDYSTVVRNSYSNHWGNEERSMPHFPFSRSTKFDVIILVLQTEFMVFVNGNHFVNYKHRFLPLTDIEYFDIVGDVEITSVRFCVP